MDLLTNSVNVPAERAKLRALRDEFNAKAQHRITTWREYTARGFLRDVQPLEAPREQGDGETPLRPLRVEAEVGISAAIADVREASPGCCGRCSSEGCMGEQGVSK